MLHNCPLFSNASFDLSRWVSAPSHPSLIHYYFVLWLDLFAYSISLLVLVDELINVHWPWKAHLLSGGHFLMLIFVLMLDAHFVLYLAMSPSWLLVRFLFTFSIFISQFSFYYMREIGMKMEKWLFTLRTEATLFYRYINRVNFLLWSEICDLIFHILLSLSLSLSELHILGVICLSSISHEFSKVIWKV